MNSLLSSTISNSSNITASKGSSTTSAAGGAIDQVSSGLQLASSAPMTAIFDAGSTTAVEGVPDSIVPAQTVSPPFREFRDFLERQVLIHTGNVSLASDVINPWELWRTNPAIARKLENFRYFSGDLELTIQLVASNFVVGASFFSYTPGSIRTPWLASGSIRASSHRPEVAVVQYGASVTATLKANYMNCYPMLPTSDSWAFLGGLERVTVVPPTNMSDDTSPTVEYNIFAKMSNVKIGVPQCVLPEEPAEFNQITYQDLANEMLEEEEILPQAADEISDGPTGVVSAPASAVAAAARALRRIPLLAPFARITELGASKLAAVSSLFGYSAPSIAGIERVVPVGMFQSTYNQPHAGSKLSLDCKNELVTYAGNHFATDDPMTINYMASRPSWLYNGTWSAGNAIGTLLETIPVYPGYTNDGSATDLNMTCVGHVAFPFRYWRGSLKYTFSFVSTPFNRGKVVFFWSPHPMGAAGALVDLNEIMITAANVVVDISEARTFEVTVPWMDTKYWLRSYPDQDVGPRGFNGYLNMAVLNPLSVQGAATSIDYMLFMAGGDDFTISVPDGERIKWARAFMYPSPTTNPLRTGATQIPNPQAVGASYVFPVSEQAITFGQDVVAAPIYSAMESNADQAESLTTGESIRHLNQVIKRMSIVASMYWSGASPQMDITAVAATPDDAYFEASGDTVVTSATFLSYFRMAYVGWTGSLRYMATGGNSTSGVGLSRGKFIPGTSGMPYGTATQRTMSDARSFLATNGCFQETPVSNAQVEVPYYRPYSFEDVRYTAGYDGPVECVTINKSLATFVDLFQAAAEDFRYVCYIGPPHIVYLYANTSY